MLIALLNFIKAQYGLKIPAVFFYASTRMFLAALTTLVVTIILGPYVIRKLYQLKTGHSIRVEDCPLLAKLHEKKRDTPTMGGILILFSMLLALVLWMDWTSPFTWILGIATIWLGLIGGIDDYLKMKYKNSRGLSGKRKLFMQTLFALGLGLYMLWPSASQAISSKDILVTPSVKEYVQAAHGGGSMVSLSLQEYSARYFIPFLKQPIFVLSGVGLILGCLITWFTVVGSSNAVNLTDGLDGLASGCLVMVSLVLGIFAFLSNHIEISRYLHILYIEKSGEIAIYLFALAGATLGFLWYNGYPAQVFMGDTGSLALGGLLGVAAVLLRREVLLALVGGIFVVETISVILQVGSYKLRNKKRIFLCTPLHHHFEYKGWPETKVVIRFWIVGFILAMIGIASLKFQ